VWLKAVEKMVKDGTSKTSYLSGFHILKTQKDCEKYLTYFRTPKNRVIVPCYRRGDIRSKSHSRHPVFLAQEIKFISLESEDRYEKVLLNMINHYEDENIKALRNVERLKVVGYGHSDYKIANLTIIETTRVMIKDTQTKINTIWACLDHYRSLLGINHENI